MKSILTTAVIFSFFSCQPQKEIIRETQLVNPTQQSEGGVDQTGGGNGLNGIALDKFIEPVTEKEAYKNVQQIITTLTTKFPRLAADFYHIANNRDWYFVPVTLPEISRNILGTYAPTDQLALQDLNKIWIDKIKFDQMTIEDQSILIIHEIMMGVRLIKYKSRQDTCIAKAALYMLSTPANDNEYKNEKTFCRKNYPVLDGVQNSNFSLSTDDYDLIRKLVSKLIQEPIDTDEIISLIETYKYRDYSD